MLKKLLSLSVALMLLGAVVANARYNANPASETAMLEADAIETNDTIEADIDDSEILYWIGYGDNSVRFIVNWADTALAWGVRFESENLTVQNILDAISMADPRFTVEGAEWITDILFVENNDTLKGTAFWAYNVNGTMAGMANEQQVVDGDMIKFGDTSVETILDSTTYDGVWTRTVFPVSIPVAEEADIDTADIVYWIGEGEHSVRFIVNWADTALAWGYRFSEDSVIVEDVMNAIQTADHRFTVEGQGWINDIVFVENNTTHKITEGQFWSYNVNGFTAGMANSQKVVDGDMIKWGDPTVATVLNVSEYYGVWYPMTQVWEMTVNPVSEYVPTDADIAESEILYWVGTGNKSVRFIVNWADTALAWGYHFSTDSVIVEDVMNAIQTADPRFTVEGQGWINDIVFVENNTTHKITEGQSWSYNVNGATAGMANLQKVGNGDMIKWGDPTVATVLDSMVWNGVWYHMTQVWEMTVYPVSAPVSILTAEQDNINVYPNPASSVVYINGVNNTANQELEIYNMMGAKVYSMTVAAGTEQIAIATSQMNNGVYIVNLGGKSQKLIVKH